MNKWISVLESLPKHLQLVLATDGKKIKLCEFRKFCEESESEFYIGYFYGDDGSLRNPDPYGYKEFLNNATHWMDLPKLPEEIEKLNYELHFYMKICDNLKDMLFRILTETDRLHFNEIGAMTNLLEIDIKEWWEQQKIKGNK